MLVASDTTVAQNTDSSGEKPISMKAMIETSDRKWNQYFFDLDHQEQRQVVEAGRDHRHQQHVEVRNLEELGDQESRGAEHRRGNDGAEAARREQAAGLVLAISDLGEHRRSNRAEGHRGRHARARGPAEEERRQHHRAAGAGGLAAHRGEREIDEELARTRMHEERAVDGEQDDQRRGDVHRRAVDAFQRHVHVADQARQLVALVGPRRRQVGAEEGVRHEAQGDDRHHPPGGAAHRLEDHERERHAESDVPVVRQDRAVEEIVAAGDQVGGGGDARRGERPVPGHDAVLEAPRQRKDEEGEEQHRGDVDRPQVLGADDGIGGVQVEQRGGHRDGSDERGEPAREPVLHALLALDHLLGPRQRLGAHFLGRLVQPRDVFAHCLPLRKPKAPPADWTGLSRGGATFRS
jgi:hypothetical protein